MDRLMTIIDHLNDDNSKALCALEILSPRLADDAGASTLGLIEVCQTWKTSHMHSLKERVNLMEIHARLKRYGIPGIADARPEPCAVRRLVRYLIGRIDQGAQSFRDAMRLLELWNEHSLPKVDAYCLRLSCIVDYHARSNDINARRRIKDGFSEVFDWIDSEDDCHKCMQSFVVFSWESMNGIADSIKIELNNDVIQQLKNRHELLAVGSMFVLDRFHHTCAPTERRSYNQTNINQRRRTLIPWSWRRETNTTVIGPHQEAVKSRWCDKRILDAVNRLQRLHRMDVYVRPSDILTDRTINNDEDALDDEEDSPAISPALKLFETFAESLSWANADSKENQLEDSACVQRKTKSAISGLFLRLLRFGKLLGLPVWLVKRLVVRRVAAAGRLDAALILLEEIKQTKTVNSALHLLQIVRDVVHSISSQISKSRVPAIMIFHLHRLLQTCIAGLIHCPVSEMIGAVELGYSIMLTLDMLLNSDLLDMAASHARHGGAALQELTRRMYKQNMISLQLTGVTASCFGSDIFGADENLSTHIDSSFKTVQDTNDSPVDIRRKRALLAMLKIPHIKDSFHEVPMLMHGVSTLKLAFDYLTTCHPIGGNITVSVSDQDGPAPSILRKLVEKMFLVLRNSQCLFLSLILAMRHRDEPNAGLERILHVCQELSVKVLRGATSQTIEARVDTPLALALMYSFEIEHAWELLRSSVAYSRDDFPRLKRLARLAMELSTFWNKLQIRYEFERVETNAKWCQLFSKLQIKFEPVRFAKPPVPNDPSTWFVYHRELLPRLLKKSSFDVHVCLEYGRDYQIMDEDVCARCIELLLLTPLAAPRCLTASRYREGWCLVERYRAEVPPAIYCLSEELIKSTMTLCFINVFPYDYSRIRFTLDWMPEACAPEIAQRLGSSLSRKSQQLQLLECFSTWQRCSPHTQVELAKIEDYINTYVWASHCEGYSVVAEQTAAADVLKRLAAKRLPFHELLMDPTPILIREIQFGLANDLEYVAKPLNINPDDLRVKFLQSLTKCKTTETLIDLSNETLANMDSSKLVIDGIGLEFQREDGEMLTLDTIDEILNTISSSRMALQAALFLRDNCELGESKIRLATMSRSLAKIYDKSISPAGKDRPWTNIIDRQLKLLQSLIELKRSRLGMFSDLLVASPSRCCVLLYEYLAPLLMIGSRHSLSNKQLRVIYSHLTHADGESDLHEIVTNICRRHLVNHKHLRNNLIEWWLTRPGESTFDLLINDQGELVDSTGSVKKKEETSKTSKSFSGPKPATTTSEEQRTAEMKSMETRRIVSNCAELRSLIEILKENGCVLLSGETKSDLLSFVQEESDQRSVDLVTFVAQGCETARAATFLLRHTFSTSPNTSFASKCRSLACLFRISSPADIQEAYHKPVEELRTIWLHYFYMNALYRLGIPQEFKPFYFSHKAGLARSLWRTHKEDVRALQLVAALCLDFEVCDDSFWNSILTRLSQPQFELMNFLFELLLALHEEGFLLSLPHDAMLQDSIVNLICAPVCALCSLTGGNIILGGKQVRCVDGASPLELLKWIHIVPYLMQRCPFSSSIDVIGLVVLITQGVQSILNRYTYADKDGNISSKAEKGSVLINEIHSRVRVSDDYTERIISSTYDREKKTDELLANVISAGSSLLAVAVRLLEFLPAILRSNAIRQRISNAKSAGTQEVLLRCLIPSVHMIPKDCCDCIFENIINHPPVIREIGRSWNKSETPPGSCRFFLWASEMLQVLPILPALLERAMYSEAVIFLQTVVKAYGLPTDPQSLYKIATGDSSSQQKAAACLLEAFKELRSADQSEEMRQATNQLLVLHTRGA
eukprot:GHVL01000495.1.p1 GENE.GHVL01000495.1~~GHVL01000495.1.p1  ORF type:complete len:2031 (+),score=357.98 GHVL01000495.1:626-6094(+)